MSVPYATLVPTPTPSTDWPGNLRDVIDTQQQTIKFLLSQWDALNAQVAISGGNYGDATGFAMGALIPSGWWQPVIPTTGHIVDLTVDGNPVPLNAPSVFWSDGTAKIAVAGVTLAKAAVMQAPVS